MKRIVIDTFGADAGPAPIIEGALGVLDSNPDTGVLLVGDEKLIKEKTGDLYGERIEIINNTGYITAGEDPKSVLFDKRDISMTAALDALRDREDCIGLLSAGNTGALMVGSIFRLKLIDNVKCPALSSSLPCANGKMTCLVDCGANIDADADTLKTFAVMGNAYAQIMYDIEKPKVALLSVGREDSKGTALTKEAFAKLKESDINFIGNAEGNDLITGYADVLVSDGFAGNILLKSNEAAGKTALYTVRKAYEENGKPQMLEGILKTLSYLFELNENGGATFLGTKKPVIKMHGCATPHTVLACADQLIKLDAHGFSGRLAAALR